MEHHVRLPEPAHSDPQRNCCPLLSSVRCRSVPIENIMFPQFLGPLIPNRGDDESPIVRDYGCDTKPVRDT